MAEGQQAPVERARNHTPPAPPLPRSDSRLCPTTGSSASVRWPCTRTVLLCAEQEALLPGALSPQIHSFSSGSWWASWEGPGTFHSSTAPMGGPGKWGTHNSMLPESFLPPHPVNSTGRWVLEKKYPAPRYVCYKLHPFLYC